MPMHRSWAFQRGTLWVADRYTSTEKTVSAHVPAQFGRVTDEAVPQLLSAAGQMDPISPDALKRRLAIGCQCFAAMLDGKVVSYAWVSRGPEWVSEFERTLQVAEGEAYIWDCATLPQYRRKGLFSSLLRYTADHLLQEGIQRLWIIGIVSAPAIARGVRLAGFRHVFNLTYLRLNNSHALLFRPLPDTSSEYTEAARRLITRDDDRLFGPLIVSRSNSHAPPDTHYSG